MTPLPTLSLEDCVLVPRERPQAVANIVTHKVWQSLITRAAPPELSSKLKALVEVVEAARALGKQAELPEVPHYESVPMPMDFLRAMQRALAKLDGQQ